MKAKLVKEDILDNPESSKALATWTKMYTNDYDNYSIEIEKPFKIIIDGQDKAKFSYLFNKYRIPYTLQIKDTIMSESTLKFSDGVEFDTSGPLRAEERYDGWYVVGQGLLYPVDSKDEALEYIANKK